MMKPAAMIDYVDSGGPANNQLKYLNFPDFLKTGTLPAYEKTEVQRGL